MSQDARGDHERPPLACAPGFYWVRPRALGWWIVAQYGRANGGEWWMFPGHSEAFLWEDIAEVGARVERRAG